MDETKLPKTVNLSQAELHYLLQLAGRSALLGLDPKSIVGPAPNSGREMLLAKALIQPGENGAKDRIQGGLLTFLLPVLFPKRALLVERTAPGMGSQTLVLYVNGPGYVLYNMAEDGKHRFQSLSSPWQLIPVLLEWFPISNLPGSADQALISTAVLEKFRQLAQEGQAEKALGAIQDVALDDEQKRLLMKAIHEVKISGSFALVVFESVEKIDLESLAIVTDEHTAWAITVPPNSKPHTYRVRRTGDDFPLILGQMCDWLGGALVN